MRADYLDRFRPWFGKDGFNRFLERGAVWPQARHRHAVTFTCPGHASIGSGLDPRHSGIVANSWYDPAVGSGVYCVEDLRTAWVGAGEKPPKTAAKPASPVQMTGDSLGDRLKERFPGARVVGVALKDRASVLMAGRKADAAIWFEEKFARFVTSTYYPPRPSLLAIDDTLPAFFADPAHHRWDLSGRIPAADLDRITFSSPDLPSITGQPGRRGVAGAWTNTEIGDGLPASAPNGLAIERSFRADRSGDVYVVLAPGWMWSFGRDTGTTHGQPVDDDMRVPLAAWGPDVRPGSYGEKAAPVSIARTVAELFGFEAGEPDAPVLAPVLGRDSGIKKPMGENR